MTVMVETRAASPRDHQHKIPTSMADVPVDEPFDDDDDDDEWETWAEPEVAPTAGDS